MTKPIALKVGNIITCMYHNVTTNTSFKVDVEIYRIRKNIVYEMYGGEKFKVIRDEIENKEYPELIKLG
jgi:hypothetical protein